ncbi:MAG: transposase [Trueperaceae bacterium]
MSTRKVREVTEALCGTSFSKSTVSRLVGSLDADLAAWRERRLTMAYPYLLVDARYEHVRVNGQVVSQGVKLVTSDDHRGPVNATRKHFQGVSWQRCQVHVARNALGKVGRKHQRAISADVRAVVNAPSLEWARS